MPSKPRLQIALDSPNLANAIEHAEKVSQFVEVIEVGTILAFSEGMEAVKTLRLKYPNHILVCDMKITDASKILTEIAARNGANWVTVSAAAHIETIRAAKETMDRYDGEIQIELYGNWTMEDVQNWRDIGISQAIYHRSRDAELSGVTWNKDDLEKMHLLSEKGIELSITGGITPQDIALFKDLNVKSFIAGRALSGDQGQDIANEFRQEISRYW